MVALVPGAVLLIIALLVRRFPPRHPSHWYGYRSTRSMRSTEAWQAANSFSGKLLLWGSLLVLNTGVTCAMLVSDDKSGLLIVSIVAALVLVAIPIATELRLKDLFDNGNGG